LRNGGGFANRILFQGVPSLHPVVSSEIVAKIILDSAESHEGAASISDASVAEVVVPPGVVVTLDEPVHIAAKLLEPSGNHPARIDFDRFDLTDHLLGDDYASNDYSVAIDPGVLRSPAVALELGTKIPLFGPITFQAACSLFVSDTGTPLVASDHICSSSIDEWFLRDWVKRKPPCRFERD